MHSVLTLSAAAPTLASRSSIFMCMFSARCASSYCVVSLHSTATHTYCISSNANVLLRSVSHSQASLSFLWFPCCTLSCSRSIYNHRFWGLYLLPLQCYNHSYQSLATCVTAPSAFPLQVFMGWLCCGGEAQWLPGHCLPPLPWGWGAIAGCRAIRALHGGAWGLWNLQAPVIRPNALGVWSSICTSRPWEVFRKVPAFYSVYFGEGIPARRKLLLYL